MSYREAVTYSIRCSQWYSFVVCFQYVINEKSIVAYGLKIFIQESNLYNNDHASWEELDAWEKLEPGPAKCPPEKFLVKIYAGLKR